MVTRYIIVLMVVTSIMSSIVFAGEEVPINSAVSKPNNLKKVKFGVYIVNITNIDFPKSEYSVKFWGWALHDIKELSLEKDFEISNAKETVEYSKYLRTKYDDVIWDQFFISATLYQIWETRYYPFDSQKLKIIIEPIEYLSSQMVLIPDVEESRLSPDLKINGWEITNFEIKTGLAVYNTTSGDPQAKKGTTPTYSKIEVLITVKRYSLTTFSFIFVGMIQGSFLIVLTLISNIYNTEKEFIVGALVVSIGSQYIINSNLPPCASFGFAHMVGIITFSGLALTAILTTFQNKMSIILTKKPNDEQTLNWKKRLVILNWLLLIIFVSTQLFINGYIIFSEN